MFNIEVSEQLRLTRSGKRGADLSPLLQVLLAVDYSVHLFHGREHIQKYLLTFMNIVSPNVRQ